VDKSVVWIDDILDVDVLGGLLLLLEQGDNEVLEDSPTVWHIQVDLLGELLWVDRGVSNNLMGLDTSLDSGDKSESHLVDAIQDTLHGPSAKLTGVLSDLLGQHNSGLSIKILLPSLTLVPLWENEQVTQLLGSLVVEVDGTSDTYDKVLVELVEDVFVSHSKHLLVFSFLMRIILLPLDIFVWVLGSLKDISLEHLSLSHELSNTILRVIIMWLGIGWCSLRHCLEVQDVFLFTPVNEEKMSELLTVDIPRVVGLLRAHESGSSNVSDKDGGLALISELLDVLIFDDICVWDWLIKLWKLFTRGDLDSLPGWVHLVNSTGFNLSSQNTWFQSWKLVLSLLGEVSNQLPLWLNLARWLSESSSSVDITRVGGSRLVPHLVPLLVALVLLWLLHSLSELLLVFLHLRHHLLFVRNLSLR